MVTEFTYILFSSQVQIRNIGIFLILMIIMTTEVLIVLLFLGIVQGNNLCTFEDGLCTFVQDTDDDFNWSIGNADTPTTETGPSYDHTLGRNKTGQYVFIETSGKYPWTVARLSSPRYTESRSVCVKFYYHMYGGNAGSLSVFLRHHDKLSAPLWTISDNQGDEWFKGVIQIKSSIDYQVVFEAKRGEGFRSDIALDDVAITNGSCKGIDNSANPSTWILNAVIGTKMDLFPGVASLQQPPSGKDRQRPANIDSGVQQVPVPEVAITDIFNNPFVIALIIFGLICWSIVILLLFYAVWKSKLSKKDIEKAQYDVQVQKRAVSNQVEFQNPYGKYPSKYAHSTGNRPRPEPRNVSFPKTVEEKEDDNLSSFKARVGLDSGPSSTKYMYSLMPGDKDLYRYYEDFRTQALSNTHGGYSVNGVYV